LAFNRLALITGIPSEKPIILRTEEIDGVGLDIHITDCRSQNRFLTQQTQDVENVEHGLLGVGSEDLEEGVNNLKDMLDVVLHVDDVGESGGENLGNLADLRRIEDQISKMVTVVPPIKISLESHNGSTHGVVIEPTTLSCLKPDIPNCPVAQHSFLPGALKSFDTMCLRDCISDLVYETAGASTFVSVCDNVNNREIHGNALYAVLLKDTPGNKVILNSMREEAGFGGKFCGLVGCNVNFRVLTKGLDSKGAEYMVIRLFKNSTVLIASGYYYWFVAEGSWVLVWNQRYRKVDLNRLEPGFNERFEHEESCDYKGSGGYLMQASYFRDLENFM